MEHIFAAFREKRGPFGRAGAAGKGDDDRDDDDLDGDGDDRQGGDEEDDPAIGRSLVAFERLFNLLLRPDAETRQALVAFDLAQYICERLKPEAAQASTWLDKLIPALLKAGVPPERREDVAGAVLMCLGTLVTSAKLRWARACLLRLPFDLSGDAPSGDGVRGFQSVLPQARSFAELWPRLDSVRTYSEQVRSYLAALNNGGSTDEFAELKEAAKDEWQALEKALTSKDGPRKLLVLEKMLEYCPSCYIKLPLVEAGKLKSIGIARTGCCGRVLIWPGE